MISTRPTAVGAVARSPRGAALGSSGAAAAITTGSSTTTAAIKVATGSITTTTTAAISVRSSVRSSVRASASATDRVTLGDTDLSVTTCCLGTMTWGKQNTEQEAHEQLNYAIFDRGLNFLDTAEIYPVPPAADTQGRTDLYIGSWLKANSSRVKRDELVIATKVSGYSANNTYVRSPPEVTRLNAKQIQQSVDASLKRLGVDYVDLLQCHWPDRYVPLFGAPPYDPANVSGGLVGIGIRSEEWEWAWDVRLTEGGGWCGGGGAKRERGWVLASRRKRASVF